MDYSEPKTRKEKKGGREKTTPYTQKTIRLKVAVMEATATKKQASAQGKPHRRWTVNGEKCGIFQCI